VGDVRLRRGTGARHIFLKLFFDGSLVGRLANVAKYLIDRPGIEIKACREIGEA
jgi:hypothetical protein